MVSLTRFLLAALLVAAATPFSQGIRLLRGRWDSLQGYDASSYTTISGQQPSGLYSVGYDSEATAAPSSKGIRYNGGKAVMAGDVYPTQKAAGTTGQARASSGNYGSEANVNLGLQAIAATYMGARATAGSGVLHSAENSQSAITNNIALFKPGTTRSKGSVSFTDVTPTSTSVTGTGNGPAAIATGNEVAAMARSQKAAPELRVQGSLWAAAHTPSAFGAAPVIDPKKRFQNMGTCLQCRRLMSWLMA